MRTDLPTSQVVDAHELESKGIRQFFKIEFLAQNDPVMYITAHNETQWLGQTWESLQCSLTDITEHSSGEVSRPKFSVVNPNGLFSLWVSSGYTDGAILTMYEVLVSDLQSNVSNYTKKIWYLSQVKNLTKNLVVFECRSTMDGANFDLPARSFYPPEFPHVSLQ